MLEGETIISGGEIESGVSELKVMRSRAGYYVGTDYTHNENCTECGGQCAGLVEPNSRETDYFATEKEAYTALDQLMLGEVSSVRK